MTRSVRHIAPFVFVVLVLSHGLVQADEADPYGELYLSEERDVTVRPYSLALSSEYEWTNPYHNVWGLGATGRYHWARFFGASFGITKFFPTVSRLTEQVESRLQTNSVRLVVDAPEWVFSGRFRVLPLAGRLNFFNATTIPFDLVIGVGPALTRSLASEWHLGFEGTFGFEAFVMESLGIESSIHHVNESILLQSGIDRTSVAVGMILKI